METHSILAKHKEEKERIFNDWLLMETERQNQLYLEKVEQSKLDNERVKFRIEKLQEKNDIIKNLLNE